MTETRHAAVKLHSVRFQIIHPLWYQMINSHTQTWKCFNFANQNTLIVNTFVKLLNEMSNDTCVNCQEFWMNCSAELPLSGVNNRDNNNGYWGEQWRVLSLKTNRKVPAVGLCNHYSVSSSHCVPVPSQRYDIIANNSSVI